MSRVRLDLDKGKGEEDEETQTPVFITESLVSKRSDTDLETGKSKCGLSFLQASLFATSMEDTLLELRILAETNNELRIIKTKADLNDHIAVKYSIVTLPVTDELQGIDYKDLGCNKYKLDKLAADRKLCADVFVSTYLELSLRRCYVPLIESNQKMIDRYLYYEFLIVDEAKNKVIRRELAKQVRQLLNHIKTVTYDTDTTIETINRQLEDYATVAAVRSRYTDNWERARTEQHLQSICDIEKEPSDVIKLFRQRLDNEARVHSEVELLTNISINETLTKIEDWMNKYDKDTEQLDLKIQKKKVAYQTQMDTRIEMEDLLELHDTEMKEWIDFKDRREKARLYHLKMTNAAISVQSWWRGLLVRLQLGPYKVAGKGKGGKPPKKGK